MDSIPLVSSAGAEPKYSESAWIQPKSQSNLGTSDSSNTQIGTEARPVVVELKNRPKAQQEADDDRRRGDTKDFRDRWTFRVTVISAFISGLLLLVGGCGVLAALRTLNEIKRQADTMEAQFKEGRESSAAMLSAIEKQAVHTEALAKQAVRQADLTHEQIMLANRPWIAVDATPASSLVFNESGCSMMLKVTTQNVGQSVAKHISIWADFAITGIHNPNEVLGRLCAVPNDSMNTASDYGDLLFPNQTRVQQRPAIANPEDIQKAIDIDALRGTAGIGLHVVGCVNYQSSLDPQIWHQTTFVFILGRPDHKGLVVGGFDPRANAYDRLILMPTGHGASAT